MKRFLSTVLTALFLVACGGGGGGGSDVVVAPPQALRTDLLYGYYGSDETSVVETVAHINLLWESQWKGPDVAVSNITYAKLPTVMEISQQLFTGGGTGQNRTLLPVELAKNNLRVFLTKLQSANVLKYVFAFYPIDELDLALSNPADIVPAVALIRQVASEFPELANVKLVAIYTAKRGFPYMELFDYVGFDSYDSKSGIFTDGEYKSLVDRIRQNQKTILVPGGAFGQDPIPFMNFAETHPEVGMIVPFLWIDTDTMKGIKNLPVRDAYVAAGMQVKLGK